MATSVADRIAAVEKAWTTPDGNFQGVLDLFADDVVFSDYATGHLNMNKEASKDFLASVTQLGTDFVASTRAVTGSEDYTIWEAGLEMTMSIEVPTVPYRKGERAKLTGVSLITWKDGKIVKEADYYVWVKPEKKE